MRTPNSIIVLKALLHGHTIVINNFKYCMDENFNVCAIGKKRCFNSGKEEEVLINLAPTLDGFIKWCDKISESDIMGIVFNTVITESRHARDEYHHKVP